MNEPSEWLLTGPALERMQAALHAAAAASETALGTWLRSNVRVTQDAVEQVSLQDAGRDFDGLSECICGCTMSITGTLTGQLLFVFGEASGLALADLVLGRAANDARTWSDVETSAALETANLIGCCHLNVLQEALSLESDPCDLLPSPPQFRRDYAESILEFALMSQVIASDIVFLAGTRFHVAGRELDWTFLLVPDAESLTELRRRLNRGGHDE